MDGLRFDALTRRFPRLSALQRRTLFALALGSFVPRLGSNNAAAGPGCKNVGKKCRKQKDCCSGICKGKKGKKKSVELEFDEERGEVVGRKKHKRGDDPLGEDW